MRENYKMFSYKKLLKEYCYNCGKDFEEPLELEEHKQECLRGNKNGTN